MFKRIVYFLNLDPVSKTKNGPIINGKSVVLGSPKVPEMMGNTTNTPAPALGTTNAFPCVKLRMKPKNNKKRKRLASLNAVHSNMSKEEIAAERLRRAKHQQFLFRLKARNSESNCGLEDNSCNTSSCNVM